MRIRVEIWRSRVKISGALAMNLKDRSHDPDHGQLLHDVIRQRLGLLAFRMHVESRGQSAAHIGHQVAERTIVQASCMSGEVLARVDVEPVFDRGNRNWGVARIA